MSHALSQDPQGNPAGSTRKNMALGIFVSGILFMAADIWVNGGANAMALAAYTGTGPTLYTAARANHEIQVRKLNGG